jgi:two-component system sensor histidine kinase VicK
VIDNIVDNAVKYRDKENAWLRLSVTETPDRVRLSIADNGAGIPEEKRHRIFDRFYRVDEARSSQIGGHGIGLAIAKSIVEAHGGRIWAESTEKVGTTVHLSLVKEGRDADTDR